MVSGSLMEKLLVFRADRDWEQFHNLRTLSTSIALEAAELAEFTQWARDVEVVGIARERHAEIAHEIADIAILLSYLAHDLGVDVERAVAEKLELNDKRYPVAKAKGSAKKYDRLD
jgi:NTP pyrophosphatase (non-canonical NTP hydrolase)